MPNRVGLIVALTLGNQPEPPVAILWQFSPQTIRCGVRPTLGKVQIVGRGTVTAGVSLNYE